MYALVCLCRDARTGMLTCTLCTLSAVVISSVIVNDCPFPLCTSVIAPVRAGGLTIFVAEINWMLL